MENHIPLSDERLAEIREREQAASPRPWTPSLKYPHVCWVGDESGEQIISANLSERPAEDIAFVAAAREDVPALVAEVERLRAELAEREWSDMLTHQACQNKKHADWGVDSERNHLCPWCAIDAAVAQMTTARDALGALYDQAVGELVTAFRERDRLAKQVKHTLDLMPEIDGTFRRLCERLNTEDQEALAEVYMALQHNLGGSGAGR